ncbi:MAG: hypothetical protein GY711_30475 [bacterium]|nr:hypothetical protein [bacterium]
MESRCNRTLLLAAIGTMAATSASAQIISDDFEVDSSADYTIVNDGTPDGTQSFAFDYIAAGIPLAPRSAPGDTGGLKLTVNDTVGTQDAHTLFHNTAVSVTHYKLTVDVWMNFVLGNTGTTEHAHVGVGGDGVTFNQLFSPISGSGAYIAFDGDGDSISDYRWYRACVNNPPGDTACTTLPNDHASYLGHGSNNTGVFFQGLFTSPPATTPGSPGNIWTTLEIEVDNTAGVISFLFDGQLTFQGDFSGNFTGFTSLGIADVFTSLSQATNFTLYDNFLVEEISAGPIGNSYCGPAIPNSTGFPGVITAAGSTDAGINDVILMADQITPGQFGYFLAGQTQGFFNPPGSSGLICLMGNIGRYNAVADIITGPSGSLQLDLTSIPVNPPQAVQSGETWNFQLWYRDVGSTSNFTDGVSITFQ